MQSDSDKNETLIRYSSRSIYRRLFFELISPFAWKHKVSLNSNWRALDECVCECVCVGVGVHVLMVA